jgi:hypothetical protein
MTTIQRKKIFELRELPVKQIAIHTGLPYSTVYSSMRSRRLIETKGKFKRDEILTIKKFYAVLRNDVIADMLGRTPQSIVEKARRMKLSKKDPITSELMKALKLI